MIILIAEHY